MDTYQSFFWLSLGKKKTKNKNKNKKTKKKKPIFAEAAFDFNNGMATTQLSHQIFRPRATVCISLRRRTTELPFPPLKRTLRLSQNSKWAVRLSLVQEQSPPRSTVNVQRSVDFLYDDLPHLFDDQGIDRTAYD